MKFFEERREWEPRWVAPVRERGLKCRRAFERRCGDRRSREGAWIEIAVGGLVGGALRSLP